MHEGSIAVEGRRVGYAEVGPEDGAPVVMCHPTLASRVSRLGEEEPVRRS
jgi:hypothetical protein